MKILSIGVIILIAGSTNCRSVKPNFDPESLKKYVYKIYVGHPDSTIANRLSGTGFFVQFKGRTFFVTARHVLIDVNNELPRSQYFIIRVTDSVNKDWNLIADFSQPPGRFWVQKMGDGYADVTLFEVPNLPSNVTLNYVEIFSDIIPDTDVKKDEKVYLPGFPAASKQSIVHASTLYTDLLNAASLKNPIIYTKDTAQGGMSGAPLFIVKKENGKTECKAIGICSGYETTGAYINKGIYFHIGIAELLLKKIFPD